MHTMRDHFHLAQIDQPLRPARARALCRLAVALAILLAAGPAAAQQWRSPLWGRDYVVIERQSAETLGRARVTALLGPEAVEYEAFTAAYLPRERSAAILGEIERASLPYQRETDRWERLAARTSAGLEAWSGLGVTPRPVPGLYLARFAFPVRPEWLRFAAECGAEVKAVLDSATVVLQSAAPASLPSCRGFRHLAWLDPFSTTDRAEPGLLAEMDDSAPASWSLQFFQGTSLEEVLKALPAAVEVLDWDRSPQTGILLVQVLATRTDILRVLEESGPLLALAPDGEASPSDERQGQILAGNHNGTAVTATGYLAWLSGRGLSTAANQQTVAVFDTGYDDGTAAGPHHPDLENPRRYLDGAFYTGPSLLDTGGHGTMVAGIVAGNGATGTGAADCQGFHFGTGIAPQTRLVPIKIFHYTNPLMGVSANCSVSAATLVPTLRSAFEFSRNTAGGASKALLSNHSWNGGSGYTTTSVLYDEMVVDANSTLAGAQPMTVVVSAGNGGVESTANCLTAPRFDSVSPPATAKNVITVGATENYRPVAQACQPGAGCGNWCAALAQDATNVNRLAQISSKGKYFERYDVGDPPLTTPMYAHNVRIKPDLVAPGVRVTSTVPYQVPSYLCTNGLCAQYFPGMTQNHHSYAQGTSFSAPAVTGAAALVRKRMLDGGVDPAPSLVKAALIATADNLGGFVGYAGDHRPSHLYGWGRVNLNRATDAVPEYLVNESAPQAVTTGVERSFPVTVDDVTKDVYVVLVWSDPPSALGNSQAALVNDLRLTVSEGVPFWRGNNFQENLAGGVENGYSIRFALGGMPIVEDSINTVEAVFIPANTFPAGKQLTLKVTGVSVAVGPQKFAVYGYNLR